MQVDKIIEKLGGNKKIQKLLRISQSAVSNYRNRGKFPDYAIPVLWKALKKEDPNVELEDLSDYYSFNNPKTKTIVVIVGGGIAAYKTPDLIRRIKENGYNVIPILTKGGSSFITDLTLAAVSENTCYTDLFDLTSESEMGHIKLARKADLVLVAPATADIIAKITHGICDDLATTLILATAAPIIVCPSMNPYMWSNPATIKNIFTLRKRSIQIVGPEEGMSACGEKGVGRLSESSKIIKKINYQLKPNNKQKPLKGIKVLVTSGPTQEPIDEVRYISNYSTGKQGHAIVEELTTNGADVILVTGPVKTTKPLAKKVFEVKTAEQMLNKSIKQLPVDIAICVAAVSDWKAKELFKGKIKKNKDSINFEFIKNPDILEMLSKHNKRPKLVIGFAAETMEVINFSKQKLIKKECDWILGNKVGLKTDTFGSDNNQICFITHSKIETWPKMKKKEVAKKLVGKIINSLELLKDNV